MAADLHFPQHLGPWRLQECDSEVEIYVFMCEDFESEVQNHLQLKTEKKAANMAANMAIKLHLSQYIDPWRSQNGNSGVKHYVFMDEDLKSDVQDHLHLK